MKKALLLVCILIAKLSQSQITVIPINKTVGDPTQVLNVVSILYLDVDQNGIDDFVIYYTKAQQGVPGKLYDCVTIQGYQDSEVEVNGKLLIAYPDSAQMNATNVFAKTVRIVTDSIATPWISTDFNNPKNAHIRIKKSGVYYDGWIKMYYTGNNERYIKVVKHAIKDLSTISIKAGQGTPSGQVVCSVVDSITFYDTVKVNQYQTVYVYDTIKVRVAVTDTLIINTQVSSSGNLVYNTIKVYPNPAKDKVFINTGDFNLMNGYEIVILNIQSQEVFRSSINQQSIDITNQQLGNAGTYVLNILNPQGSIVETRKLIIQ